MICSPMSGLFVCCLFRFYTSLSDDQFVGLEYYIRSHMRILYIPFIALNNPHNSALLLYFNCSSHSELECRGRFADSR